MDPFSFNLREYSALVDDYNSENRHRGSNRAPTGPSSASRGRQRSRPAERTNRRRAQSEPAASRPRQARRTDSHARASDDLPQQEQCDYEWQQREQQQQQQDEQQRFAQHINDAAEAVKQYQSDAGPAGAEASLSEWHQRKQADHQQWRQQSSAFCCAMLQQQAGPGDTATCGICGSDEVMIRRAPRRLCRIATLAEPAM